MERGYIVIEVCERLCDYEWSDGNRIKKYHSQVKDNPGLWSCGKSEDEAVGSLIRSNKDYFGISVNYLGVLPR